MEDEKLKNYLDYIKSSDDELAEKIKFHFAALKELSNIAKDRGISVTCREASYGFYCASIDNLIIKKTITL